jgi:hypothetical protein
MVRTPLVKIRCRAFLLCYSLDLLSLGQHGRVIFGPYFLVPFGLASAILVLEIGIVSSGQPG